MYVIVREIMKERNNKKKTCHIIRLFTMMNLFGYYEDHHFDHQIIRNLHEDPVWLNLQKDWNYYLVYLVDLKHLKHLQYLKMEWKGNQNQPRQ